MARIGYVGLGVMGGGVARRLLEAGQAKEARMHMRAHLTRVEREVHEAVTSSRLADFATPPPPDEME